MVVTYRPPDTPLAYFSHHHKAGQVAELSSPTPTILMMGDMNITSSVMQLQMVDGCLVPSVLGHRIEGVNNSLQIRLQTQKLYDLDLLHHILQQVDRPIQFGKEKGKCERLVG